MFFNADADAGTMGGGHMHTKHVLRCLSQTGIGTG